MKDLSLEIILSNGDKKVFPLSLTSQTVSKGGKQISIVTPWLTDFEDSYLAIDIFTNHVGTFEIVNYCFVEGCMTSQTIDDDDDNVLASYRILLDGNPVTYEQIQNLSEVSA
jgi:hypothetical protein